jgi:hypothetical protein
MLSMDDQLRAVSVTLVQDQLSFAYQHLGEGRPEGLVVKVVFHKGQTRDTVTPMDGWYAQHIFSAQSWHTQPRHQRRDSMTTLDQRQCQRVRAPCCPAHATGWKNIARE